MGTSAWPEEEISSQNERLLLEVAFLRPFGVNYLEGAICPELGLLAHPHGSSVFLLPFCPVSDIADVPPGACAAKIDVRPRRSKTPSAGEYTRPGEAATLMRPVRGLSWTRGVYTRRREGSTKEDALAVATGGGGVVESNATRCTGDGLQEAADVLPGVFSHLAVACGSDVRLWKVSRFKVGGEEERKGAAGGGCNRGFRYATTEVLTEWDVCATDGENMGTLDGGRGGVDGVVADVGVDASAEEGSQAHREQAETALPVHGSGGARRQGGRSVAIGPTTGEYGGAVGAVGNVRGLSFKPVGRRGARVEAGAMSEEEAVPLAAWYDTGAAMLGSGNSRAVLPAPVANKRACGAWSGCGRRLAVSSGGEIRVYTNPLGQSSAATVDSQRQQRPVAREGWATSGRSEATGEAGDGVLLARGEQEVSSGVGTAGQSRSGFGTRGKVGGSGTEFHTVLCAEAALQGASGGVAKEGGAVYSPCSSPPSSKSPKSTKRRPGTSTSSPSYERSLHDASRRPPASDTAPSDRPSATTPDREQRDNRAFSNHSKTSVSLSSASRLIGDIRSMCPAGAEDFFGATDGGLGLRSLFGSSDGFSNSTNEIGSGMNEDSLLGAIVNDSAVRGAAMDAAEAVHAANISLVNPTATAVRSPADGCGGAAGEKPVVRRGGFRNILPGDNWLAGSVRPRPRERVGVSTSEQLSPRGASPGSEQSPPSSCSSKSKCVAKQSARLVSEAADIALATVEIPRGKTTAVSAVSDDVSGRASALATSCLGGSSVSTAQVLDLRGKLGGDVFSGTGNAVATAQHPLFRISFGTGMPDAAALNGGDSGGIARDDRGDKGSLSGTHRGDRNRPASRRPWLVRVACSSSRVSDGMTSPDGSVGGVKLQALASLPPALASPDLLASSEDGRFVAIGSHACGLVACYRVSSRSRAAARECVASDVGSPAQRLAREGKEKKGSAFGGGLDCLTEAAKIQGGVGGEEARPKKKKRPRAMPAYTLRLPPGHKAKGLVFVGRGNGRTRAADVSGSGSTSIADKVPGARGESGNVGTANGASDDDAMVKGSDEAVLLVLAACPVASVDASPAYGSSKQSTSTTTARRVSLEPPSLQGSYGEGSPFRTVLLRFLLPDTITSCKNGCEYQAESSTSASPPPILTETARVLKEQTRETAAHPGREFPDEGYDRPPSVQEDARADGYARDTNDEYSHRPPRRSDNAKLACKRSESSRESAAGECSVRRERGGEFGTVVSSSDTLLTRQRTMVPPLQQVENQPVGSSGGCGKTRTHSGLSVSSAPRGEIMACSPTLVVAVRSSYDDDNSVDGHLIEHSSTLNVRRRSVVQDGAIKEDGLSGTRQAGTAGDSSSSSAELGLRDSILGAIEGVERRMGQRLDGIERMLHGVCERVESLERAVVNNH